MKEKLSPMLENIQEVKEGMEDGEKKKNNYLKSDGVRCKDLEIVGKEVLLFFDVVLEVLRFMGI